MIVCSADRSFIRIPGWSAVQRIRGFILFWLIECFL